jgi:hypothetical protein
MPYGNTTFYLISVKPFYKIDELIEVKSPKPEYNSKDVYEDIIVVDTTNNAILTPPLKHSKGRPYKNLNITLFL